MVLQSSYDSQPAAYLNGQLTGLFPHIVRSKVNGEGANIPFAVAVVADTGVDEIKLPDAVTDRFLGIAAHTHAYPIADLSGADDGVEDGAQLNVVSFGDIVVTPENTVSAGDQAYMRVTAGAEEQVGAIRGGDSDSGDCVRIPAFFVTAGDSSTPAVLHVMHEGSVADEVIKELTHAENADGGTVVDRLFRVPADRHFVLESVHGLNPTGLAEHAANFTVLTVQTKAGSPVVLATWSTETGQEGTIAADTLFAFTLASAATLVLAPGTIVDFSNAESGTTTVPEGHVFLKGRLL